VRRQTTEEALRSELIKRGTASIYVLRVQSGAAVAFRPPFFEPLCYETAVAVFTHCVPRRALRGQAYARLLGEAEERRVDWVGRFC
jgi:hypothetical protein